MASNSGPSAVYVLDIKGKPLISRDYRGDVEASAIDKFFPLVMDAEEEEGMTCPIIRCDDCTFMYVKYGNVYLVCAATRNANVMLIFVFLHKLIEVFKEYFKELEEESIRDNFVIIYELLDELMDFGYPQTTDPKILQLYITQQGRKLESAAPKPPMALTNAVSWRNEGATVSRHILACAGDVQCVAGGGVGKPCKISSFYRWGFSSINARSFLFLSMRNLRVGDEGGDIWE
eukprot:m.348621 g.348621  ORF g.348621 m.348621 type:complete len:232 (-) comp20678_c0_seq4:1113-1808(-)